jgi:hypothetical protein
MLLMLMLLMLLMFELPMLVLMLLMLILLLPMLPMLITPMLSSTTATAGKWTADKDKKLRDAVLTHGCNYGGTIALLVPGRAREECRKRWHYILVARAWGSET